MIKALLVSGLVLALLLGWLLVNEAYRRFARRHPELGPFRREGSCGAGCSCSGSSCERSP